MSRDSADVTISGHWKPEKFLAELSVSHWKAEKSLAKSKVAKPVDAHPSLSAGKWNVREAVKSAESSMKFERMVCNSQTSKAGFGRSKPFVEHPVPFHGYRKSVADRVVKDQDEKASSAKAVSGCARRVNKMV